jgi:hypothetical protein
MQNKTAKTPDEYLADLPADRRDAIAKVRSIVQKNLPKGYTEFVSWGMLNYGVPLTKFANTGNGQPLCYAALAAQKNYCSLYLMSVYGDKTQEARLRDGFKAAGKKLDMGKSCVRFKTADDLPLDVVGEVIASIPADKWIEIFQKSRKRSARG